MRKIVYLLLGILGIVIIFSIYHFVSLKFINQDALEKINNINGVETCKSISPRAYATGLIGNPSNDQTTYWRSECFQKMAILNSDKILCEQVKERKSLFFDGSAISRESCIEAVSKQMEKDYGERVKPETIHQIRSVNISQMPNADTATVQVSTNGTLWGTYEFSILLYNNNELAGTLYNIETHLGSSPDNLGTIIYKKDFQELLKQEYQDGQEYDLKIKLKLIKDDAGQLERSNLSDSQIESVIGRKLAFKD